MQLFKKVAIALLLSSGFHLSADEQEKEGIVQQNVSAKVQSEAERAVKSGEANIVELEPGFTETFQDGSAFRDEARSVYVDGLNNKPDLSSLNDGPAIGGNGVRNQEALWNALYRGTQTIQAYEEEPEATNQRYGNIDMFVLISLSMPETSIIRLFEEHKNYEDKNIIFLLRGWDAPHIEKQMTPIYEMLTDTGSNATVAFDPTVFNAVEANFAPLFVVKNSKGEFRKVLGDVTLHNVFQEADSHYDELQAIGATYPIVEPDMIAFIKEKSEEIDWDALMHGAKENLIRDRFADDVVVARENATIYVDPSTRIKKDIV